MLSRWGVLIPALLVVGCVAEQPMLLFGVHGSCGIKWPPVEVRLSGPGLASTISGGEFYPERAMRMGVMGSATVECTKWQSCSVVTEDGNYQFGYEALRVLRKSGADIFGRGPATVNFVMLGPVQYVGDCSGGDTYYPWDITGKGPSAPNRPYPLY